MVFEKLDDQQLIETKDVISRELEKREELENPALIDFRIAFDIAIEAINLEQVRRQQYQLI